MKEYLVWYKRFGDPEWRSAYHIIKARTDAEAQRKVYACLLRHAQAAAVFSRHAVQRAVPAQRHLSAKAKRRGLNALHRNARLCTRI